MKKAYIVMGLVLLFGASNAQPTKYSAAEANQFAFDMYKQMVKTHNKNIFFSPLSISGAMGMTYAGANGETKEQMAKALLFPLNDNHFHKQMGSLQNRIAGQKTSGIEIAIANRLWAEKSYKFKCRYTRLVKKAYGAPIQLLNFKKQPNESRLAINQWVEQQTQNRIKNLLPDGSISPLTTLVLTNAIYFKGQWAQKFETENTHEGVFSIKKGEEVTVPMMNMQKKFNLYQGDNIQLVELPYIGNTFSMLVLLPNESTTLFEVEKALQLKDLNHYLELMTESDVRLTLPKFRFEAEFELKPALAALGMPLAFSNEADLSLMSGRKDLKIDQVYHKAFVEVSEEGTEAAAATAVVVVRKSVTIPVEFNANRPFLFIIRENSTGNFLFMGRVTNPL